MTRTRGGCQRIGQSDLGGDDSDDDDSAVVVPADGTDARGDRTGSGSGAGAGTETCPRGWMWSSEGAARVRGWGGGQGRVATRGATVDRRDDGVDGTTRYKTSLFTRGDGRPVRAIEAAPNVEEGGGAGGERGWSKAVALTNVDIRGRACVASVSVGSATNALFSSTDAQVSEFGYCRNRATDVRPIPFIPTDFRFPKGWHSCAYRHPRAPAPRDAMSGASVRSPHDGIDHAQNKCVEGIRRGDEAPRSASRSRRPSCSPRTIQPDPEPS